MPDWSSALLSGSQTTPPALIVWHIGTARSSVWQSRGSTAGAAG